MEKKEFIDTYTKSLNYVNWVLSDDFVTKTITCRISSDTYVLNSVLFNVTGKGDLVGCDISKHLDAAAGTSGPCPEVIVKSSCDVRALTYCDLKCLNIPGMYELTNWLSRD